MQDHDLVGAGRGGVAAAGGHRRVRLANRGAAPWPPTWATSPTSRTPRTAAAAGMRWPAGSPGLFDGYATHRPDMLTAWAAGRDEDGWGAAGAAGRGLAAGTLAPAAASGSPPPTRSPGSADRLAELRADPAQSAICPNGSRCSGRPRCRPGSSGC